MDKTKAGGKTGSMIQYFELEETAETGQKSSEKILELISKQPHISAKDIAKTIRISSRAVEKHIARLKKQGILKRIGPDKGGYRKIIESEKDSP